jgi:fructokinase
MNPKHPPGAPSRVGGSFSASHDRRPVIAGQVGTFFPENRFEFAGQHVLNVVWHLGALGCQPILLSRVGDDNEGRRALRILDAAGTGATAVQIDSDLPTMAGSSLDSAAEDPVCAWQALEISSAIPAIEREDPSLLYHGMTATESKNVRNVLNTVHNRIAMPFAVDLDVDRGPLPMRTVRRALLGVKWIRVRAEHVAELVDDPVQSGGASIASQAIAVQSRFALDGVAVEHNGLPILTACENRSIKNTESPPDDSTYLPGARDAAAAILVMGLLLGWAPALSMERAAQFAFLVGSTAVAHRVDPVVHSRLLRYWDCGKSDQDAP